jgi:hypothetical protein
VDFRKTYSILIGRAMGREQHICRQRAAAAQNIKRMVKFIRKGPGKAAKVSKLLLSSITALFVPTAPIGGFA